MVNALSILVLIDSGFLRPRRDPLPCSFPRCPRYPSMIPNRPISLAALMASACLAAACNDIASPSRQLGPNAAAQQGGTAGGGGATGGGGGGGVTTPTPSPLPTTAPAADILMRESFGPGPDLVRPTGGKGTLKSTSLHTTLNGFWLEYPGSSKTQWITPDVGQT